jgi:aryl-alcohol dehydrogenase-like predicted oxidoreductase
MQLSLRTLGDTEIQVTPVALGCWPISGMTSVDVNERDSLATIQEALDCGINFLDTAYCYGAAGESERMIGRVLRGRRDSVVLATKGGVHWDAGRQRVQEARPETLLRECGESLRRLETDHVDLLYLHAADPSTPVAESAGALQQLRRAGKARAIGASNLTLEQLQEFHRACPLAAFQPPYNMLQRQIERELLPWCRSHQVAVIVYWPLMKGLLAGRLPRDHRFAPGDGRVKYPMFQGEEWQRNQDFLDDLREMAAELGRTVAQLVVNWTIHQPGVTAALCGAKRPEQIRETAGATGWRLTEAQLGRIEAALLRRGTPTAGRAI